jgi:rhodanese-related sulfurtransferase
MPGTLPQVDVGELPDPLPSELVVLDVRESEEWDAGHVAGSVHIPLTTLPQRLGELPADHDVLVVCKVGARSAQATMFLQSHGIAAANLVNGLIAWEQAGRLLVNDAGTTAFVA